MYNYTLSDFIARLNVARRKHLKTIIIKPSNIAFSLLKMFEEMGIIRGYFILEDSQIEVQLRYISGKCVFRNLIVISKPSRRIYVDLLTLHKMKEKYSSNTLILSTDLGFMFDVDCLKNRKGGVVLLRIIV